MSELRIGAKLPEFGPIVNEVPLSDAARRAEAAGFDSVWASDHIVMVRETASTYPYSRDGDLTWDPAQPRFDAVVSMTVAATATERVEVGVAVMIAALRNPLVLATQLATLDVVSRGRVVFGVGAGWLAEEFEALEVPFETRGSRLNEWIEIARDCWTGTPAGRTYEHYTLPEGVLCYPTPVHDIPILVGGMSPAALKRAGRRGDGWLAFQRADAVDLAALEAGMNTIRREAGALGRVAPRMVVRLTGPLDLSARAVPRLEAIGVTEVIVETDWRSETEPQRTHDTLRAALS
jgi:probable F420-dependent oxidoreductase